MSAAKELHALMAIDREARALERKACADLVENLTMSEVLLATGEMSAQERRTTKALQKFFARKIRSRT